MTIKYARAHITRAQTRNGTHPQCESCHRYTERAYSATSATHYVTDTYDKKSKRYEFFLCVGCWSSLYREEDED